MFNVSARSILTSYVELFFALLEVFVVVIVAFSYASTCILLFFDVVSIITPLMLWSRTLLKCAIY